jgi:hypothetical protein
MILKRQREVNTRSDLKTGGIDLAELKVKDTLILN